MVRVRFAPSPTGYLHLGNIRTALFNFLFARHHGGKFIFRVEDTDRERSRPEFEKAQIDDLLWMGVVPDEGPGFGGDFGPYRQSERLGIYRDAIRKLIDQGHAYDCYVTEEEVEEMRQNARAEKRSFHFDNRGRSFSQGEIAQRKAKGIRPAVRFKIENPHLEVHDLIRGKVSFNLDDMVGDFIIQRADGMPTFHLVVCVDDARMEITHVIRGEDHLSNTPKHLLLFQALGAESPQFGHLPLVQGEGGQTLSKRLDSVSMRAFRGKGYLPHALANYMALLGWSPGNDQEIFTLEELQRAFDLGRVGRSSAIFDPQKLDWMNGEHLRRLSGEEFAESALRYLEEQGSMDLNPGLLKNVLAIFQDKIERFDQLPEALKILQDEFDYEDEALMKADESKMIFRAALEILDEWSKEPSDLYQGLVEELKKKVPAKGKSLFHPIRMAVTGRVHGPELKRVIPVLGRDKIKGRFRRALQI